MLLSKTAPRRQPGTNTSSRQYTQPQSDHHPAKARISDQESGNGRGETDINHGIHLQQVGHKRHRCADGPSPVSRTPSGMLLARDLSVPPARYSHAFNDNAGFLPSTHTMLPPGSSGFLRSAPQQYGSNP